MSLDFERIFQVGQRVLIFGGSTHVGKAGAVHNETRCKVRVCLDETNIVALKDKKYVRPEDGSNNNNNNSGPPNRSSNGDENMPSQEAVAALPRSSPEAAQELPEEEGCKDVTISFGEIDITDDNKVDLFQAFKLAVQSNLQVAHDEQVFEGEPLFLTSGTVLVRFLDAQNASKIVGSTPLAIELDGDKKEHINCHVGFRSGDSDFNNFDGGAPRRHNNSQQNILGNLSPPSYPTRAGPWNDEQPQDRAPKRARRGW